MKANNNVNDHLKHNNTRNKSSFKNASKRYESQPNDSLDEDNSKVGWCGLCCKRICQNTGSKESKSKRLKKEKKDGASTREAKGAISLFDRNKKQKRNKVSKEIPGTSKDTFPEKLRSSKRGGKLKTEQDEKTVISDEGRNSKRKKRVKIDQNEKGNSTIGNQSEGPNQSRSFRRRQEDTDRFFLDEFESPRKKRTSKESNRDIFFITDKQGFPEERTYQENIVYTNGMKTSKQKQNTDKANKGLRERRGIEREEFEDDREIETLRRSERKTKDRKIPTKFDHTECLMLRKKMRDGRIASERIFEEKLDFTKTCCYKCVQNALAIAAALFEKAETLDGFTQVSMEAFDRPKYGRKIKITRKESVKVTPCRNKASCPVKCIKRHNKQAKSKKKKSKFFTKFLRLFKRKKRAKPKEKVVPCTSRQAKCVSETNHQCS